MPRFVFRVKLAVVPNVPPPKISFPAVALPGAAPRLLSALMLKVPTLMVAMPLNVFAPERVSIPVPVLVNDKVPAVF